MTLRRVLVELTVTEQRYRAVLEVQAGVPVTEVAERFGVSRQAVHRWVALVSAMRAWTGWRTGRSRPHSSPGADYAARWRRRSASCGVTIRGGVQRRIEFELGRNGCPGPVPSRITDATGCWSGTV